MHTSSSAYAMACHWTEQCHSVPSPLRAGLSHMTERTHEIGVVPSGALDFAAQGGAIGMSSVDVERQLAQDREVLGSVVFAGAVAILGEVHVERPVEPVLDAPVTACDLQE